MMQISMFDGSMPFKINKPLRVIELFGGYGSQSLALKYLGVPFEHWLLSEWAVPSIQAYKDLHFGEDETDYSKGLTQTEVVDWLEGRISRDYNQPMTREQIERCGEAWQRKVYNNMKASKNLGSVMKVKGEDLNIVDTDKFTYLLTHFLVKTYHLAGDSIVSTVLMAIFGQMFEFDWKEKINNVVKEITNERV
jgi:hypothetical protein